MVVSVNRAVSQADRDALERCIDQLGLAQTLDVLAELCGEKADHIQSSYAQGASIDLLAKTWAQAGRKIAIASASKPVTEISCG